jgi:signal transduction histidine kinase
VVSIKSNSNKPGQRALVDPIARFATDFTRLITDVDRLMVDISKTTEKPSDSLKLKSVAQKTPLNGRNSMLGDHAESFVKSLQQFASLPDRVPVPFMELDRRARIIRTNDECAEMLNGSGMPLSGQSLFSFVADSDTKRLRKHLAIVSQTDKPCAVALSILRRGRYSPVELRIRREVVGNDVGYVAVVDSLDQLRNANRFTRQGHGEDPESMHELVVSLSRIENLRAMADVVGNYCRKVFRSPAGMMFIERDGDLHLAAQWRCRQIRKGKLAQEIIKNGPVARAFRTGKPIFWHERMPHSTVSRCLYRLIRQCHSDSVTFLPIRIPDRPPVGVLAIVLPQAGETAAVQHDHLLRLAQIVSASIVRARAHDEALAARVRAESATQSKEQFLSVLSHELKNSMMPILGWAVALSSGTLGADKQNLALEGIVRNVRTLNYLIEDLFDAARISSGKLRLQPAEIRIQDVAREALTAIQNTIESKKLRISTDISEAIPAFIADSRRVHQVLLNLLNNAVKFTPSGGSIGLQVRRRGDNVECVVSDTGKGIERKFLPFVFDRFRQENRPSKVHAAGLGLGLSIVREIVQLHGGSIQAFSDGMDKGATFIVRLPMRRRHGRGAVPQRSASESDSGAQEKHL